MKRILAFFIVSVCLVSCASTVEKTGKISVKTSPSTAVVKFNETELKKGDLVALYKSYWSRAGKAMVQRDAFLMNGVVEKVMENSYYEIKFERNDEFQEGDKIKKI